MSDVIWNWPTPGDKVHVEGIWVWERGHPPVHTEIHPAHFVAVQRKLPVSFILNVNDGKPIVRNDPRDNYIATRVDIMANADGSAYWNTRDLPPLAGEKFAQVVEMNRKDYSFIIHHPFKKPLTAPIAWKVITQKGDNFPSEPIIRRLPNDDIEVTIPWKTQNVINKAVFARTILVYWDAPASRGVLASQLPKLYRVRIKDVNVIDKKETISRGEFRIFCNVGSDWIFLNEFPAGEQANPVEHYLGNAEKKLYFINKYFSVYVPSLSFYRIYAGGWEADGINEVMGMILNGYNRNVSEFKQFACHNLIHIYSEGAGDDDTGAVDARLTQSNPMLGTHTLKIFNQTDNAFELVVQIEEVNLD